MRVFRTVLALGVVSALAATQFGGCADGPDDGIVAPPLTFQPTTTHNYATGSANQTTESFSIVSSADLAFLESQSGVDQTAGNGLILASVTDATGTPLSGVTITPIDDTNAVVGTVVYRNSLGGLQASLTATSGVGSFVVFNVPPGRVNLRATAGDSGNVYLSVAADEAAIVTLEATVPFSTITWTGFTRGLTNVVGAPVGGVTITGMGTGAGVFPAASGGGGDFTTTTPPALNTYLVQLSGGGFATTLNVITVGSTALASPAADLLGVTPGTLTSPTFTPASVLPLDPTKGVLRGVLVPTSPDTADGYTVTAHKADGSVIGGVRYGGTTAPAGAPDDTLTASSTNGIFYIYNIDAGPVLVTASKTDFAGGATFDVAAGLVIVATIRPSSLGGGTDPILVAGSLRTSSGTSTVGFGSVSVEGLSGTSTSDVLGIFALPGVPSNQRLRVRATKP